MQTTADLDQKKRIHKLTLIFAILRWLIEKRRVLINYAIITYQLKFQFSLQTSSHMC